MNRGLILVRRRINTRIDFDEACTFKLARIDDSVLVVCYQLGVTKQNTAVILTGKALIISIGSDNAQLRNSSIGFGGEEYPKLIMLHEGNNTSEYSQSSLLLS